RMEYTPGAASLVATMRAHGAFTMLASGGFSPVTAAVRSRIGFDRDHANNLEFADGYLTGKLVGPILDKSAKRDILVEAATERGIGLDQTMAVGDGANDLPMLQTAGLGVAFQAKPSVAAAVQTRINQGDLRALLYLQGYRDAEIVTPPSHS
ncbi:MAG: HAD-IB family phosphatase, partial [Alphaproteobacteria bacterium]|nr:HAD-IB family phosphatase [Alphaproteobacteria bacterium]